MSSLAANDVHAGSQPARSRMFWVLLGALAAAQLFALWLLCIHQVRKAEARHNETVVQQMALSDCLQYIPGSTIASCSSRNDLQAQAAAGKANVAGAVPVSFSYR